MSYYCCYCGMSVITSAVPPPSPQSFGKCESSPHKIHELVDSNAKGWKCYWCGNSAGSKPYAGTCSRSPHKTHKWFGTS